MKVSKDDHMDALMSAFESLYKSKGRLWRAKMELKAWFKNLLLNILEALKHYEG